MSINYAAIIMDIRHSRKYDEEQRFFIQDKLFSIIQFINKYYNSDPLDELEPVCARQDIIRMINEAGLVTADDEVRRYIVRLVNETRNNSNIAIGASPRATLALLSAAKANAYINGKTSCSIDDVKNIAVPVLAHRIKLKPKNLTGQLSSEEVINNIVWN